MKKKTIKLIQTLTIALLLIALAVGIYSIFTRIETSKVGETHLCNEPSPLDVCNCTCQNLTYAEVCACDCEAETCACIRDGSCICELSFD